MYPRSAPGRLVALVMAGLLDLGQFDGVHFPLAQAGEAVAHARASCVDERLG